ncbi:DNA primase [Patescibacteria group bacterium]|nr:DNA primase [Patescibacteria group bacterium]MBU1519225.1 DNA primase [Patescibacteria group bacterium]MBU2416993.1 DNA primase [Patescibacteria group bacterium]MBU2461176.1 DNA primase [Patescibacteria group bacterium]
MSKDTVEQIKSRLNMIDVAEGYVKLQKAGKNFKALSPFTNEKTPSFFVSPDQGLYYCFSSGKGGDMFTFVQEMEGVDFAGALKILAKRAGVELSPQNPKLRDEREKLFAVLEMTTRYYEKNLRAQPQVIEYLKKRGITGVSAKAFRIGYAPEGWRGLHDYLLSRGFSSSLMEKAGLVVSSTKGYYDRFRGRIMFPIFNSSGIIVAFSGRIFSPSGANIEKTAKYVNSSETSLYNKSEILYGFDKAKQAIREKNLCVFVEGQIDLVLAHQAGTQNCVAVSGTALSKQHLSLIRRFTENLVFAFDADNAGVSAVKRGIDIAIEEGFETRVACIPQGQDPADIINEDVEKWKKIILNAEHIIDFYLNMLVVQPNSQRDAAQMVEKIILPYVVKLGSSISQAQFVSKITNKLGVVESSIWKELGKIKQKSPHIAPQDSEQIINNEKPKILSRKDIIKEKIKGVFYWQLGISDSEEKTNQLKEKYEAITGDKGFLVNDISPAEKGRLIFEAEIYCNQKESTQKQIDDLLLNLKKEILKEKSAELYQTLKQTENSFQLTQQQEADLLKQIQDTQREIDNLGSTIIL